MNLRPNDENLKVTIEEAMHFGTFEWDIETNTTKRSDEIYQIYGIKRGENEISVQKMMDLVHPDDRQNISSAMDKVTSSGQLVLTEYRIIRPDGELRYLSTGSYILKENGKNSKVIGYIWDITEKKINELALKENEEMFRSLSELSLMGIAIIQDDVFKYCNQRYSDITGFSIKELLNMKSQGFLDLVHPDYQEKVQEQARLKQMGKKDGIIQVYEFMGIKKTGENYWGEIFSKTFNYRGFKAILVSLIDITERKRTEDKLKQMNEKLEDSVAKRTAELEISNEELRSFSYSISHDLKSPLRSISGFSQAMKEDYYDQIDDLGKDFLDRITKGCSKMSDLIDDLLKLSKVSRSDINFERFNYSEEIKSLVKELEERNSDKKYEIKLEDNIIIYGDKRLLKILARNLLENSFK
ncbi:MAG: PAS domain S-box protein, partial [archaeon]|nr:PAS domain S-box protein [archaeon]